MEVTIIPEDFRNAPTGYRGIDCCVLWQALHRAFPSEKITVEAFTVRFGKTIEMWNCRVFLIDNKVWGTQSMSKQDKPSFYHPETIDDLSIAAKESLDGIPTIKLTLTPLQKKK